MKKHIIHLLILSLGLPFAGTAKDVTLDKPGQFVRIELPKGGELTLAEVEIYSNGKNIAPKGKASQSSVGHGGVPQRAIDGNKHGDYGKGGQTHTGKDKPAWWEIDLGGEHKIENIQIWNRNQLQERLEGFTISVFDLVREPVFVRENVDAPHFSMKIDLKAKGKITYLNSNGKPGKPHKSTPKPKSSGSSSQALWSLAKNEVPEGHKDPAQFEFKKGDVIASIGNALAERMQYAGWTETLIQSQELGKELRFRNLAISGDRVESFPRSRGFMPMDAYLQHIEANVVFAFFGYNESYNSSPEDYANKLKGLINNIRATKPADQFPRIVLFSPIAHEDLDNPNLPDGKANNERLAKFAEATQAAAKEVGVTYVDIFTPSQRLYKENKEPLTINGVHLNELGNKLIGEVITQSLTGVTVKASKDHEKVREAVLEKNTQWFDRYRAVDGNDVWGGRSGLRFVGNQTNADVLRHELIQLDVMTANRDPKVWAIAANKCDHEVDDSNVPKDVPVISNVGGKGNMSSAQKEGTVQYLSPEESLKTMAVGKDYQLNVFADESRFPDLINPVQMQVDGKGRLWVAAWRNYPKQAPIREHNDALLIFEDNDRDGVADKMIKFAEIANPLGFEFWGGGVVVSSQPNLVFLKDTDGDDKADYQEILLHGIGSSDTHHACNNLIYGPDGGIYWQSGIFLQNNFEHPWGTSLATGSSAMYRFDPRRFTISHHGGNSPNPHGIAFDRWGYHYATDGTGGRAYQVRPEGKGWKMHGLLKKEVRPVPASEILSSGHFPDDVQQHFLICNSIGFLGIKQYKLDRGGEGSERKLGEVWGEPSGADLKVKMGGKEMNSKGFLLAGDKNFRPTDAIVGEDGALYVSDWANVIIGHMQHNIRDPHRDHKHGRIVRVTHKDRPLQKPVKIDGQPIPALLDNLKHPVDGVRHRTRVELSERNSQEVISETQKWIQGMDESDEKEAHHLLEALWLHQQHNIRDLALLNRLMESPVQHVSVAAKTVQHHWFNADPALGSPAVVEDEHIEDTKGGIVSDTKDLTTIHVATLVEKMKYNVKSIDVKAGKKIRIVFSNPDFLPHNLLVVKPKTADKVAAAAVAMGAEGFAKGFRPDSSDILAGTKMLDNKQKETIEFTLPGKGTYEFVCTFPGHHILMRGTLNAK